MPSSPTLDARLDKYVELIVRSGLNLQPDQELFVSGDIAVAPLVRKVVARAYELGASEVTVHWTDEDVSRLHYDSKPLEMWKVFPDWLATLENGVAKRGAALLFLDSEDPFGMTGVDPRKFAERAKAAEEACKDWRRGMDFGLNVWCIVGAAAPRWASRVFPDLPVDEAVERLWDAIFATVHVDEDDPVAFWAQRKADFERRKAHLNGLRLDRLHYTNALGTDITVGLNGHGLWDGGGSTTQGGTFFFPNMPTEEVFTTPDRNRVDGTVFSAMPLNHGGTIIDGFSITFEGGRVTDFSAREGEEALRGIIETDEGAHHLGECALVPKESPIHQSGILFLSTLFDENAACHFALGMGFPECFEGGLDMDKEQLLAAGVNQSATHVDFMLGTDDLRVTGYTCDGAEIPVFENGTWAF